MSFHPASAEPSRCPKCQYSSTQADDTIHSAWCGVHYGTQGVDWEIQPISPAKGLGIVALRPFEKDERILVDRLLSQDEFMDPSLRTQALELAGGPSLGQKYITNCIGSADDRGVFGGICMRLSRANHACDPAAVTYYDIETKCMVLHAARPIAPGEEITISYTEFLDPTCAGPRSEFAMHAASLAQQYGIVCPADCACKSEAHLGRKRRSEAMEKCMLERIERATTIEEVQDAITGIGIEWVRFHNDDFPLRTRFRVRKTVLEIGRQFGLELQGLKVHEHLCRLLRPGAQEVVKFVGC